MNRRAWVLITVLLVGVLAVAAMVAAASEADAKGGRPTTTPPTQPALYTCQDRIDNGAVWVKGEYHPELGYYLVRSAVGEPIALPACFDLLSEHAVEGVWRVEWRGEVLRPPGRGLALWFEKGLHGVIYDEMIDTTGIWFTEKFTPDADYFVFVAMPHRGDKWTWVEIKVYPPSQP